MIITVELASTLAQVTPAFLLLVMVERFLLGPSPKRPSRGWQILGALARYSAVVACFTVFAMSLFVVWSDEDMTGPSTLILLIPCAALIASFFVVIMVWFERQRKLAEQYHDPSDNQERRHEPPEVKG